MASIVLAFLCVSVVIGPVWSECINGWTRYDDSCYRLFRDSKKIWPEAVFECEKEDAYLASIETQRESTNVHALVAELNLADTDNVWIGLSDVREENVWVWEVDRKNATFFNWGSTEPNQTGTTQQDCVILYGKRGHTWADDRCEIKYYYLCERPLQASVSG
ncbi:macrophage mannose receptor 1-like [Haliotis rufescens]|uniref:macrophage mannose receptor 1-like n=1 Tax=Haliotis rufescens TaxID=6454 RepID=UPI001EB09389|nr:macrophage mannose receptor 1-like [Haliotis rufescens]